MREKKVFIDLDGTLVKCQTQAVFAAYLAKKGLISYSDFFKTLFVAYAYKLGYIKNSLIIRREMYALLSGVSLTVVENLTNAMFSEKLLPKLNSKLVRIMEMHRAQGDKLILMTGSLDVICKPIVNYFCFDEVYSTRLIVKDGLLTGDFNELVLEGVKKADFVNEYMLTKKIRREDTVAYCDSVTDIDLLKVVGTAFVVNPNKEMNRIAGEYGWITI